MRRPVIELTRLRNLLQQVERRTSLDPAEAFTTLLLFVVALAAFVYGAAFFGMRLWFESLGPYNGDTPLYWTVGRGMLHGLVPYRDLYETKPPGIFLLSALSYLLTSGFGLTHVTQFCSLLFVALAPLALLPALLRTRHKALRVAPVFLALWALVLLIASFVADHGSAVQVEPHGLVGVVAYTLLLGKRGRLAFLGRALGVALCIGMKEPFFLLLPAVYLVTSPNAERKWKDLFAPLALAGAVGTVVLVGFGWFTAYTRIYLKSMLGSHVKLAGSPIARTTFAVNLAWDDLHNYSALLPAMLIYCMAVYLFLPARAVGEDGLALVSKRFQALVLGLLLAGLAVGMGGTFYDHHFIFAVPLYLAVLFVLMARLGEDGALQGWLRAGFVMFALATVWVDWTPAKAFRARADDSDTQDRAARQSAEVIDAVLNELHVARYLYLGPGGYVPYPYTSHAPLGPLFFQQVMFFEGQYPWFVKQFRRRLEQAQVVVMHANMTGPLNEEVRAKLAAEFHPAPERLIPPGKHCEDPILIRNGLELP